LSHIPPLSKEVLSVLKPIYENLSSKDLLERCLGVYSQNNENLNSLNVCSETYALWKRNHGHCKLSGGASSMNASIEFFK